MKSSSFLILDKLRIHCSNKERCSSMGRLASFLFSSLALTTIFSFFFLYSPSPLKMMPKNDRDQNLRLIKPPKENILHEKCDLFKGHWVPDFRGSQYTNSSCSTIPISKNCFRHGRKDTDFINWRWKPENCHLPRFDAKAFLTILRGKKLAFIGDSVARNHMESLLCLLSQEEIPIDAYKDSEDRHRIWYFAHHDFTLTMLWSKFLVVGEERMINGSSSGVFDLQLDKIDEKWSTYLPIVDYAIISNAHWFFRPIYLHQDSKVVGCVYCDKPNITKFDVVDAIGLAFRGAFKYINECKQCKKIVTVLRTFSPAHFENGTWNTGGSCNRKIPYGERDIDLEEHEWKLRSIQVEEIERARKEAGRNGSKRFRVLDVTRAMLMRPDGHPGAYWGNKWMKGYNDCVHWCLPGPIDVWSDFLMAFFTEEGSLMS